MREILFRGKRKDNGEWVEGCYVYSTTGDKHYIICDLEVQSMSLDENDLYATEWYEVIPETIGQFTGLTDKKGKKIFEGDIILCDGGCHWFVAFEEGAFVCKDEKFDTYFSFYEHSGYDKKTGRFKNFISEYEVVGNVQDSPQFWEGSAE